MVRVTDSLHEPVSERCIISGGMESLKASPIYPGMFGYLLTPLMQKTWITQCLQKYRRSLSIHELIVCTVRSAATSQDNILPCKHQYESCLIKECDLIFYG